MNLQDPRLVLAAIVLLFAGPLVVAVTLHSERWGFRPDQLRNEGHLVQPPVPIDLVRQPPQPDPSGRWAVLYPLPSECATACWQDLAALGRLHRALGRRQQEVEIVLLDAAGLPAGERTELARGFGRFTLATTASGDMATALDRVTPPGAAIAAGTPTRGGAFIIDPGGNIILSYAPGFDPGHIKKDLQRLLH